ncbi:MAG TPA: hypothetical protein VI258_04980 [Rhodanobacteraceae bacterium]
MKRTLIVLAALSVLVFALPASAAVSANGSLAVTGTVAESIQIVLTDGSLTLTNGGTANATAAAGTIQKFGGSLTGGFAKSNVVAGSFDIGGTFNVEVDYAGGGSLNYNLTAELNSSAASGTTWKLDSTTLNNTAAQQIVATGTYGSPARHTLAITIANSASGAIDNTINLVATSN